ncbi:uncharacterized protein LOC143419557 isoform X2 [Maylandia zebra]|uniref:uncharacterized protein LOC143419557 isoform X2 n=1 Tax=Maylandia zebra TaxID=106582 RepID=UPI00403C8301
MESVPVRRRSCLLRFRERCPFRKLCRRTYDADTHMEEDLCAAENHQNHQSHQNQQQDAEGKADNHMELDDDVDPETGERAQG